MLLIWIFIGFKGDSIRVFLGFKDYQRRIQKKLSQDFEGFKEDYQRGTSWNSEDRLRISWDSEKVTDAGLRGIQKTINAGLCGIRRKTINVGLRGIQRRLSTSDCGIQRRLSTWDFVGFKEDYERRTLWDSKKIINTV